MDDHFTSEVLDQKNWLFCNMSTPCCEIPKHVGDSMLYLPEHQMWNEGNCLLGRKFLRENSVVSAIFNSWDEECTGAAIGFYAGNGSFLGYVMLAVTNDKIELRVHSGSQNGESFQAAGQPKWFVAADMDWKKCLPVKLTLKRDGDLYIAEVNDAFIFQAVLPEIKGDARPMYKALPWHDRFLPTYAYLDWAMADGFAPTAALSGRISDEDGKGVPYASVHIAGFVEFFTHADENGDYIIKDVPRGKHVVVAAAENFLFAREETLCAAGNANICDIKLAKESQSNIPRKEYNNPSFDRSEHGYYSLNGTWQFQFDPDCEGVEQHWYAQDTPLFDKNIRVPFSWSSLMGFGEEHLACGDYIHESNTCFNNYLKNGQFAWYRRSFTVPDNYPDGDNVILHIGACSNVTYLWLDGKYMGMREDEYSDLVFDLGALKPGSYHTVAVKVQYPHDINSHNMGKQIFWFSSAPGIWQSVWIEHRKTEHITGFLLTPELEFDGEACVKAAVHIEITAESADSAVASVKLTAPISSKEYDIQIPIENGIGKARLEIREPELWQYLQGNIYSATAKLLVNSQVKDKVKSYVGLRKVETRWLDGHSPEDTSDPLEQYQYVFLNNKPFYVIGILDQCYNAFGIYTYRSFDEEGGFGKRGSIKYDIDRTIAYGYNLSRVHIKENEPLWYHECDVRGLPVWTEHPGNFYATPEDPNWQRAYYRELDGMLKRLNNFASIMIVSPINESWGVEGCHCSTPWENELRAQFLEANANRTKAAWPHVLVCDNSGFGKTNACEINDFHIYPNDHWQAKEKWDELVSNCYPGSTHNFINKGRSPYAVGTAAQTGRPVMVSEFLHINGIDMQLRMYEKIAGYLRMNVASHETENSGPLTAERFERDYGYVNHKLEPIGYDMVNNMDMIVPDKNRIEYVEAGHEISIDVYTSHFSLKKVQNAVLHVTVTGIDRLGKYVSDMLVLSENIAFSQFAVEKQKTVRFIVPEQIRGAYVFFYVSDGDTILCRNYIQLYVKNACKQAFENEIPLLPGSFKSICGDYVNVFEENEACVTAITGRGTLEFEFDGDLTSGGKFVFEASAHEGKNAVKVTDELLFGSNVDIMLDGKAIGSVSPKDEPSDERALFSNGSQSPEPYNYHFTGRLGYGERFEITIPTGLFSDGKHSLTLKCDSGGMALYGSYMGRYGFDPVIIKNK